MYYKLALRQYEVSLGFSIAFVILALFACFVNNPTVNSVVVLYGGLSGLTAILWPKPNYGSKRLKGRASFNYLSNDGLFSIGRDDLLFTTKWSKSSDVNIYLYNDHETIDKIALAKDVNAFKEVRNPDYFDFSSRAINLMENEIAVIINSNGYYALVRVVDVKDANRNDDRDEVTIEWVINPDKEKDFFLML